MPQTRFVPGGRIVEEFIPDVTGEGFQGFSGDRPTLAVDMFGQINTGDPKTELARRLAAQRHDEAEAQASAKARFDAPRFFPGMAEQPDSVAAIDRELFAPIRKQYGVPEPPNAPQHEWFRAFTGPNGEHSVLDTRTGQTTVVIPGKTKPDEKFDIPLDIDGEGKPIRKTKWTLKQFADNYDNLSEGIKKLPEIKALKKAAGILDSIPAPVGAGFLSDPFSNQRPMQPEGSFLESLRPAQADAPPSGPSIGKIYMGPNPASITNRVRRFNPATQRIE